MMKEGIYMSRSGIVNVRMVITEEKILSNIEKVHKMINPKSKKQIIQLDDDTYFKDLVEAIKTYLVEYPKKQNFPASVYNAAFNLVEFATSQFEDNTKQIESLIRQRELNISLGGKLKELLKKVETKEKNWKEAVKEAQDDFDEDIINKLLYYIFIKIVLSLFYCFFPIFLFCFQPSLKVLLIFHLNLYSILFVLLKILFV